MEVIKLHFILILSTIFTAQWVIAQEFSESGYDLHKGPVFYEAYYYPEKQTFHKRRSVEENDLTAEEAPFDESVKDFRNAKNAPVFRDGNRILNLKDANSDQVKPIEALNKDEIKLVNFIVDFIYCLRKQSTEELKASRDNNLEKSKTDEEKNRSLETPYRQLPAYEKRFKVSPQFHRNYKSQFSKNNYPSDRNFVYERSENPNLINDSPVRDQNLEYAGFKSPPVESLQENIFEPRPQVIRYLFSAPRGNESGEKKSNFIKVDAQVDAVIKEPGIASIEVSEEPRHKIRHHHGETPRRNYSRQ